MSFGVRNGLINVFFAVPYPVNPRIALLVGNALLFFLIVVTRLERMKERVSQVRPKVLHEIETSQGFAVGFVPVAFHQFGNALRLRRPPIKAPPQPHILGVNLIGKDFPQILEVHVRQGRSRQPQRHGVAAAGRLKFP